MRGDFAVKLVERDGSFLFRPNSKDKRRNLYAVIGNKSSKILWKNKAYIVENIQNGCISNAKLQGDNIVRVKEEIRIEKINETNYNILKRYASNFLSNVREEDMIYMFEDCERYKSIVDEEYKNKYLKFGYIAFYGNLLAYTFTVDDFFGIPINLLFFALNENIDVIKLYGNICLCVNTFIISLRGVPVLSDIVLPYSSVHGKLLLPRFKFSTRVSKLSGINLQLS